MVFNDTVSSYIKYQNVSLWELIFKFKKKKIIFFFFSFSFFGLLLFENVRTVALFNKVVFIGLTLINDLCKDFDL